MKRILSLLLTAALLAACIVPASAAEPRANTAYTDLSDAAPWAHEAIDYVISEGLMRGTSATEFQPKAPVNRAMMVTVLHRVLGSPAVSSPVEFSDIADGSWYDNAVHWAYWDGVVNGYSDTIFGPSELLTREQAVTMMYRFARTYGYNHSGVSVYYQENPVYSACSDLDQVSKWAVPAVKWGLAVGLLHGVGTDGAPIVNPKGTVSREQLAVMLYRFDRILKWPGGGNDAEKEPNHLTVMGVLWSSSYAITDEDALALHELLADESWKDTGLYLEYPAAYSIFLDGTRYMLYAENGKWLPLYGYIATTSSGDITYGLMEATDPTVLQKLIAICDAYLN